MPLFSLFGNEKYVFLFLVGFDLGNGIFKAKQKHSRKPKKSAS